MSSKKRRTSGDSNSAIRASKRRKTTSSQNSNNNDEAAQEFGLSTPHDWEKLGYRLGSVVGIHLSNFLTYTSTNVHPGPRLNVVVGPNGSGKSSIVCALALGLGGKPHILGRATDPVMFIQHGHEQATIEIQLYAGDNKIITIRRDIFKATGKSEWRINGRKESQHNVVEKVKRLNVQVDNLCQFLAQDKVISFAAMKPNVLLHETEKAVGGEEMLQNHLQLIKLKNTEKDSGHQYEQRTAVLEDLKKKNAALERDVIRFREREKQLEKVKILQLKKPWVIFEEQRKVALELGTRVEESNEQLKLQEDLLKPLKKKIDAIENKIKAHDDKVTKNKEKLKNLDAQRKERGEKSEQLIEKVDAIAD